jgi:hypothetical protein
MARRPESSAQRSFEQRFLLRAQGELQRQGLGSGGHFFPGFLDGVDELVFAGFARQFAQLEFQEDQSQRVFKDPGLGIPREIVLQVQGLNACD